MITEADIRTTMLVLIRQVAEGKIDKPLRLELVPEGSQAWENAWYDYAREYLEQAHETRFARETITVH